MSDVVNSLEPWQFYLIISVVLTYTLVAGGWVLAKAGRSPLWILLLLFPYVNILAVWAFAYIRWPFADGPADGRGAPQQDGGDA
ncbi:hypothetical protein [Azospirillum picis]|uniref:Cytochrome bd-type quinol oxidase subunit 1 n=1 Tax=Azospirillum picis TaxID=488438 RepID=A0ABU0MSJ7_9PROT|nr:hypothetical protein [Azospirillum picis]MBP2301991.1 cytochrome bd-type quinol oxidase subunit 1 [Azospirillum picis]MDQ0536440.1 cytochrome bd-type quinol oxidase subunit 1 [Azospirillum picis]